MIFVVKNFVRSAWRSRSSWDLFCLDFFLVLCASCSDFSCVEM